MKAVVYERRGTLVYRDVPKPVPGDDEVLVKIHAVSLNAADYRSMRLGLIPKSRIFGADIAGKVEAVGRKTARLKPGDEVVGCMVSSGYGGLAEYAAAPEGLFAIKAGGVCYEDAASLPIAGVTALRAIRDRGKVKSGHKLLIIGAGGGVGTYAVQLAKYFGAEVTAVCSARNAELIRSLGADHVLDYAREDFTKSGKKYDLILAVNGYHPLSTYKRALDSNGICLMVGGNLRQIFKALIFGRLMSTGGKSISVLTSRETPEDLEYLMRLVEEGKLRAIIDRCYHLSEGAEAMRYLAQGHSSGKVVIHVIGKDKTV